MYAYAGGAGTSALAMVADAMDLAMLDNVWALTMGNASYALGVAGSFEEALVA